MINSLKIYKDAQLKIYRAVADLISFQKCIFNYFSTQVTVGVLRGNRKKNISVTLELNPNESESDVMLSTRNVFKVSAYKMNLSLLLCVNFFLLRGPES